MMNKIKELFGWYFGKQAAPYWAVMLTDCAIVFVAYVLAHVLAYGAVDTVIHHHEVVLITAIFLPGYVVGMRMFHTYRGILRFTSTTDLLRVLGAIALGSIIAFIIHRIILAAGWHIYNVRGVVIVISSMICALMNLGMRMMVRFAYDKILFTKNQRRAFVYGVHEGGVSLGNALVVDKENPYVLSGFVTDEKELTQHRLMGHRVYLNDDHLIDVMRQKHIRALFVSPLRNDALRENEKFLNMLVKNGIKIFMQPAEMEWDGKSALNTQQLHEVDIEDLLPRDKIEVDLKAIGELLQDKVVLVTGAAGSIGYEMSRQIAKFRPKHLVLVDQAETPMHNVRLHMAKHYAYIPCETIVSSICNKGKMEKVFAEFKPDYVFHAAAYKHVPMMEDNPSEAVQNNVYGTRVIADLAVKYGTKKFVMISTDKAVNPTNVMGCSKRICEIYCQSLNNKLWEETKKTGKSSTQFITTRFGNVLGSNGSVIPLFKKQIQQGGPITVTHPDIIRFFMLIPEACRLVLEAGTMGHGGEIFVFDMGKPVRIADLAQRMIDLSNAKDVKIEYTGLRDGEKLYEEVLNDAEQTKATPHPKIMVSSVREYSYDLALKNEEELYELSLGFDDMAIVKKMKEIVPEYKSRHSKYEVLDK